MAALWILVALGYVLLYAFASVSPLVEYGVQMPSPIQMQSWSVPHQVDLDSIKGTEKLSVGDSFLW